MSAEIFDMKLYKKALKLAKKGKSLKIKPQSCVEYEGNINVEKTNQFNYCGYCGTPLNKQPKCPKCGRMNK